MNVRPSLPMRCARLLATAGIAMLPGAALAQEQAATIPLMPGAPALFSQAADASVVLPGGLVRITLRVQNVLLTVINDAEVIERFDETQMVIADAGGATVLSDGSLRWQLPRLGPGEVWERSFTLAVREDVPHGTVLSTIGALNGRDVDSTVLQEKVAVTQLTVVSALPATGASLDVLLPLLSLPFVMGAAGVHRRLMRRR